MKLQSILFLFIGLAAAINAHLRVCYYSNWSQYRPGIGKFFPEDIEPNLCTHLVYSFADLKNNQLSTYEWNDVDLYARFNNLKVKNSNLKTLLAVGGWNAGSERFSRLCASSALRKNFATTSVQFLRDYSFDGLDMDWEYPALRGGQKEDKDNFILLLKDLKEEFERDAQTTNRPRLLLTAAVAAGKATIDPAYDIPKMNLYLDFINLMSYDLHGGWENATGHNSPLYSRASEKGEAVYLNLDWAAKYWVDKGTPPSKLIIGLATYGRTFELANPNNNGMGAPAIGSGGAAGQFTRAKGFLSYYEICALSTASNAKYTWDSEHKVPYLVVGNQWIGYDDERSIKLKLNYIKDKGYGGAMVWNVALDDFRPSCSSSKVKYPLMSLMKDILDDYRPTTNIPDTTSPTTGAPTTERSGGPPTPTPITDASTTQEPSTEAPTTQAPTTGITDEPDTEFCSNKPDGLYSNPYNCNLFYSCSGGVTHDMSCPGSQYFNPEYKYCDWPGNVDCKTGTTQNPKTTEEPQTTEPQTTEETQTTEPQTSEEPKTTEEPQTTEEPGLTNTPTTESLPSTTGLPDAEWCRNKADGLYRKKDDCTVYYQCYNSGSTYIVSCPSGLYFNPDRNYCDWPANVPDCPQW